MVVVGKYRSRRRKGGNILAAVHKNRIVKAVQEVKQAVHHPFDHAPMEMLKSVEKHVRNEPEHAVHVLNQVAKDVSNFDPNAMNPMHNFTSEFPNFSGPDPYAFARSIRESLGKDTKQPHTDHEKVGGNLFKTSFSAVKSFANELNPAHSVHKGFDSLDRINMKDHSLRGFAKNAIHMHSAMLHGHAAYGQASGLMLAPLTAGSSAAGLGGVAMAQNKIADAEEAFAKRI